MITWKDASFEYILCLSCGLIWSHPNSFFNNFAKVPNKPWWSDFTIFSFDQLYAVAPGVFEYGEFVSRSCDRVFFNKFCTVFHKVIDLVIQVFTFESDMEWRLCLICFRRGCKSISFPSSIITLLSAPARKATAFSPSSAVDLTSKPGTSLYRFAIFSGLLKPDRTGYLLKFPFQPEGIFYGEMNSAQGWGVPIREARKWSLKVQ